MCIFFGALEKRFSCEIDKRKEKKKARISRLHNLLIIKFRSGEMIQFEITVMCHWNVLVTTILHDTPNEIRTFQNARQVTSCCTR